MLDLGSLPPLPYLKIVVTFIVVVNTLHLYLDVRQLRAIQLPTAPAALAGKLVALVQFCPQLQPNCNLCILH